MSDGQATPAAAAGKREATCNAILDATSRLVAEKGVDGFTMSEVAERGQINRALIYHYYHDRDTLLFETIRHIVKRYNEIHSGEGEDAMEQDLRMHIEHPEIARFFFHLMLTGKPLPALSRRITGAIESAEALKSARAPDSDWDPKFGIITAWLIQLVWSCGRDEIARLLNMSVDEADTRFIANLRKASSALRRPVSEPST